MQLLPPVDVMRTVVAVIEPFVAEGPNADTQSPTARAVEDTVCVVLTGVELDVVTLSVWVLGFVGFLDVLVLLREVKLPPENDTPDTVSVDPLTPVTLPDAMSRLANALAKLPALPPLGKLGRVPPDPLPPRNWNPPAG